MAETKKNEIIVVSENGNVTFANEVIATIAGLAANEIDGIAGMVGSGVVQKVFGSGGLSKGVTVSVTESSAVIAVNVSIHYGFKLHEVCAEVQKNIKKAIENMTGLSVEAVNVNVMDIKFETEQHNVKEIEEITAE